VGNQLQNLQLLDGSINNEKRATMPADWLAKHCPDLDSAAHYRDKHGLGDIPATLDGFEVFYHKRRERLRGTLMQILSATPSQGEAAPPEPAPC